MIAQQLIANGTRPEFIQTYMVNRAKEIIKTYPERQASRRSDLPLRRACMQAAALCFFPHTARAVLMCLKGTRLPLRGTSGCCVPVSLPVLICSMPSPFGPDSTCSAPGRTPHSPYHPSLAIKAQLVSPPAKSWPSFCRVWLLYFC